MLPPAALQPDLVRGGGRSLRRRLIFALLLTLTGIGAGLCGAFFIGLLHFIQHIAWNYKGGDFLDAVHRTTDQHRWMVVGGAGLLIAAGGTLLRAIGGGHAGEVAEAIWEGAARMELMPTFAKAAFSIIAVALGAAVGREGAPKQAGAAIGSFLAQKSGLTLEERRLMVACGAGAGMAAIYNVPLGGALFALEVLLGGISIRYVLSAITASAVATGTAWLFLPNTPTYHVPGFQVSAALFPGALLLGGTVGVTAVAYIALVSFVDNHQPSKVLAWVIPCFIYLALAGAAVRYPQVLGNGKAVVQLTLDHGLALPLATVLLVLRPLATSGCLLARTPGGLFTPTVTVGALAGLVFGEVWSYFFTAEDPASYAVLGATAFLAAATKGPISSLVLVMELTGRLEGLLVPMILSVTVAMLVSRRLDSRSIYMVRTQPSQAHVTWWPTRLRT